MSNTPQSTEEGPEVKISCLSNVYVRHMLFKNKGIVEVGHRHPYSHTSLVSSGSVLVQVYDEVNNTLLDPVEYKAPAMVFIAKNVAHQLTALEDDTVVCCIHALRDADSGTIIDPEMIPLPMGLRPTLEQIHETTGQVILPTAYSGDELDHVRVPRPFNSMASF